MTDVINRQTGLSDKERAPLAERILFENRIAVIVIFALLTAFFGAQAIKIQPDASFEKMIPTSHPYIQNYLDNKEDLSSLSNSIRIIVATTDGDIFDKDFQEALRLINDEVFYIPGVDRSRLQSIWTPNVRWSEVTEEGFRGGAVIPNNYDGSAASLEQLRLNILRSGQVGRLVANNFKSAIIIAPLTDINADTGEKLDYRDFSRSIEDLVRDKYQTDRIKIHVTGFAKVVGDLIEGATLVAMFFGVALAITLVLLTVYSRCIFATLIPLTCSTIAVVWQLGLVFAIGISHGVQIINNIAVRFFFGAGALWSARRAFRALHIPGLVALVSDGIGFLTLIVIKDSGYPGTGTDRQYWRRRSDLHQPCVAASADVLRRTLEPIPQVPATEAEESVQAMAIHRTLCQTTIRDRHDRTCNRTVWRRLLWQQGPAHRRPRCRRPGVEARFAL
jgi:predicted RND superfamily exporter protein